MAQPTIIASKPLPMPLFNFRKRQRQALVSDPQSMSAQLLSSNTAEKRNDVTSESDENSNHERKSEVLQINRPGKTQQHVKSNSVNRAYASLPDYSPNKFKSQRFQGSSRDNFSSTNNLLSKGNSVMTFHAQKHENSIPSSTHSNRGKGYSGNCRGRGRSESQLRSTEHCNNNSTFQSNATIFQGQGSFRGSENHQQDKKYYPQRTNDHDERNVTNKLKPSSGSQLRVQSGTFQSRFGVLDTSQKASGKASTDTNYGKRQSSTNSYTANCSGDMSTANRKASIFDAEDVNYTKTTFVKPKSTFISNRKLDTSMRLFTCPISLLRGWCGAQPFDGPVMFEVYGKVISTTSSDRTGTGKEFVLQDDSSSTKCVFYEIDRELPILIRGQIHRVVGTFDKKRGVLKAISVRIASKEEHQVYEAGFEKTMEEMQNLGFLMNEP